LEQFKNSLDKIFTGPPVFTPKLIPNCSQDWVSSLIGKSISDKNSVMTLEQRRNSTPSPQSPQPSKTAQIQKELEKSSITVRDRSESSPSYFLNKINLEKSSSGSQNSKQVIKIAGAKRK